MGHQGVHFSRYNSTVKLRPSPSPLRDPLTFQYISDGTGRDSYVLMDNGGYRPEYAKYNRPSEQLFMSTLRNDQKSPIKYFFDPVIDSADMTQYLKCMDVRNMAVSRK